MPEVHAGFVVSLALHLHTRTYLELGVQAGNTMGLMLQEKAAETFIGVDVEDYRQAWARGCQFFQMTTDRFFSHWDGKADLIFIDADHRAEQVWKDFLGATKVLAPGGVILLHDTDPATASLLDHRFCGDAYKAIPRIRDLGGWDCATLPILGPGLTIVNRMADARHKQYLKQEA